MPYIVTTRRAGRLPGREHDAVWSCRAVATLEEARQAAHDHVPALPGFERDRLRGEIDAISEFGGIISLPGEAVIEVAYVSDRVIDIDAFNAREATR